MERELIIEKACVFTGHRYVRRDFEEEKLKKSIVGLIKKGVDTFYCGMAVGFDMLAAEQVLKCKKKYPSIKLVACIPFYGQEKMYSEEDKKRYAEIIKNADEQVVLSERYYHYVYAIRNRYMADRSKYMIAYLKEKKGGTAMTVEYFKKKTDVEIIYL